MRPWPARISSQGRHVKLIVSYDGTAYSGSQRQKNVRTVQQVLEEVLQKLLKEKVRLSFAGRTDAGVHAEGQAASFKVTSKLPLRKIQAGLNYYLPRDIAVTAIEEVSSSFHAQFSAERKIYEYHVFHSKIRSPLWRTHAYQFPFPLNLQKMKKAAQILTGKHDFRAFESSGGRRRDAVRRIFKCIVQKKGKHIYFTIESDGFLYKMVRSMVGTLLAVGSGKLDVSDVPKLLKSHNLVLAGPTVPAHALVLKRVVY